MDEISQKAIEKMTYEEAAAELEELVRALESESHPLEEALALFERGQALVKRCAELLEQADLKIRRLSGEDVSEESV